MPTVSPNSLPERLKSAVASKRKPDPLTHPCKHECSGWSQGWNGGALAENARLQPIVQAMIEVCGLASEQNKVTAGTAFQDDQMSLALSRLEQALGEGRDE